MIADLKPYTEYKESELPWLRQMPKHWAHRRMKFLFKERVEKGFPDEPLLAATQSKGVVRKEDYGSRTVTATKDFHLLKLVDIGDFVISLRSFQGGIEVAHCRGIISPAYTILAPRHGVNRSYYSRLFKSRDFINSLTLFITGIREGQSIDYERLSRAYMPLPSDEEQAAIGKFLDWANGRLERTIRAKRKVIALLTEQKQAIIHRAVTRGLDPTVPLKPSGIPWLSDIPQHWEVLQVRRVVSFVTSGSRSWANYYSAAGLIFLQSGNLGRAMSLNLSFIQYVRPPAGAEGVRTRVQTNDVLVCITGALTGNVALVDQELCAPAFINQHVALVRPRQHMIQPRFLAYVLHSEIGRTQFKTNEYGGTKQGLGLGDVKNVFLAAPPMEEQRMICAHLDGEVEKFRDAISRLEREIELLREYRTRLVADVVTGKLDVREAASRLPHEIEGQETLGNEAALSEYDEPEEDDPYAVAGETEA